MPNPKTIDASQHVDIIDVSAANAVAVRMDSGNNVNVLKRLTAQDVEAVNKVIGTVAVEDRYGNVRDGNASRITYNPSATHTGMNDVQAALDFLLSGGGTPGAGGNASLMYVASTATLRASPGANTNDKINRKFTTANPSKAGDVVLVSYAAADPDNTAAGFWRKDASNVWQHVVDFSQMGLEVSITPFDPARNYKAGEKFIQTRTATNPDEVIWEALVDVPAGAWDWLDILGGTSTNDFWKPLSVYGIENPTAPLDQQSQRFNWRPGVGLGWKDDRAGIFLVRDEAAMLALRYPQDVDKGTIVVQQDNNLAFQLDPQTTPWPAIPSGTTTGWVGTAGAEPLMTPTQVGHWIDITTEVGYTGTFPLTIGAPVNIVVGMSDGTTRTITIPVKTYPDAAATDGGGPNNINGLGWQLLYDGLPLPLQAGTPQEDAGKLYMRIDVLDSDTVFPVSKGIPPPRPATGTITAANWKNFSDFIPVKTQAERDQLLVDGIHPETFVSVAADHRVWRWTGNLGTGSNGWVEALVSPTRTDILQRLVVDPTRNPGEQMEWVDDRDSMEIVPAIADLSNRNRLPLSHMAPGKLVFVSNTAEIYELVNSPDLGTVTNTFADWKLAGGGGSVKIVNRVADLPQPGGAQQVANGDLALVRYHADAITPLGDLFVARPFSAGLPRPDPSVLLKSDGTIIAATGLTAPTAGNLGMYVQLDPLVDGSGGGAITVATASRLFIQYSDGATDDLDIAAGNYTDLNDFKTNGITLGKRSPHPVSIHSVDVGSDGHTYLGLETGAGSVAFMYRVTAPAAAATNPTPPVMPTTMSWLPVARDVFTKILQNNPDTPDPMPRDLQMTNENGHREIKQWDQVAGQWLTIYSEDEVKAWIAAGNLFVGTIQDAGHGTAGAIDTPNMPAQTALGPTEKGKYWVWAGASGHVLGVGEIGGVASAIDGQLLNPGDWVQVAEPTAGTYIYTVIPGDLLAKARGDALYGLNIWTQGAYESGSIVVHQGKVYKAGAPILTTDPAPDDATNTKWNLVPLSAGVRNVVADANLPPTAPAGEVYLVVNSGRAGGQPAFYLYDGPSGQWRQVGGGATGTGQAMDLTGGQQIMSVGTPVGTVIIWPVATLPIGYLRCDGKTFNPTTYPILNRVLGGNRVPDLRGVFVRGANNATLDNLTKHQWTTARPRTAFTTDNPGNHQHDYWDPRNSGGRGLKGAGRVGTENFLNSAQKPTWQAGAHTHTINGGGDSETAPDHVYIHYCIKATDGGMETR